MRLWNNSNAFYYSLHCARVNRPGPSPFSVISNPFWVRKGLKRLLRPTSFISNFCIHHLLKGSLCNRSPRKAIWKVRNKLIRFALSIQGNITEQLWLQQTDEQSAVISLAAAVKIQREFTTNVRCQPDTSFRREASQCSPTSRFRDYQRTTSYFDTIIVLTGTAAAVVLLCYRTDGTIVRSCLKGVVYVLLPALSLTAADAEGVGHHGLQCADIKGKRISLHLCSTWISSFCFFPALLATKLYEWLNFYRDFSGRLRLWHVVVQCDRRTGKQR